MRRTFEESLASLDDLAFRPPRSSPEDEGRAAELRGTAEGNCGPGTVSLPTEASGSANASTVAEHTAPVPGADAPAEAHTLPDGAGGQSAAARSSPRTVRTDTTRPGVPGEKLRFPAPRSPLPVGQGDGALLPAPTAAWPSRPRRVPEKAHAQKGRGPSVPQGAVAAPCECVLGGSDWFEQFVHRGPS